MSELVRLETKGEVGVVTVDRPDALNALNREVLGEIGERLRDARDQGVRAVVLSGAGEQAFIAGADIGQMKDMDPQQAEAFSEAGHAVVETIEELSVPVIAAVDGFALGGGLELALACDIRVAGEGSAFGAPEVTLGVVPGFGGTQRLARVCGLGPGLDLVLTGRQIDAEEAKDIGLVTHLVDEGNAKPRALELAETIADNGPIAVDLAKRTIRNGFDAPAEAADRLETQAFAACFGTEDQEEGMSAFLKKREADFEGT
jgi:enoyl-CoA hydratase